MAAKQYVPDGQDPDLKVPNFNRSHPDVFANLFGHDRDRDSDSHREFAVVNASKPRYNYLLYGPGGCAKTWTLRELCVRLTKAGIKFAATSTTGVSAINLNIPEYGVVASTVHRWAGIGIARESAKKLAAKIMTKKIPYKNWRETMVLIIDEISMMGKELFEKLDEIGRRLRCVDKPFGGITLIVSGDFLQLPPVNDSWVFESRIWKDLKFVPIKFEIPKRYNDLRYFGALLRIRKGVLTKEDSSLLKARTKAYANLMKDLEDDSVKGRLDVIRPTILYSKKIDVYEVNMTELDKLPGQPTAFEANDTFEAYRSGVKREIYQVLLEEAAPELVVLKPGAQVMLTINVDVANGLANGSRGVVTAIRTSNNDVDPYRETQVEVKFLNGMTLILTKEARKIEDEYAKAARWQIPLILAYALTIHKSQGGTLDFAVVDVGPTVFCAGQAYVALSRVRNSRGLFVSSFRETSVIVDDVALAYNNYLDSISTLYDPDGLGTTVTQRPNNVENVD